MIRAREDRLLERFRRTGDPRALARLFDRTAPELWRVAAYLCRDRHDAEDVVQSTFLAAIEDAARSPSVRCCRGCAASWPTGCVVRVP